MYEEHHIQKPLLFKHRILFPIPKRLKDANTVKEVLTIFINSVDDATFYNNGTEKSCILI